MERCKVDVNVTPNKRKVFMEHEKLLLAIIKTSLLAVYVDDSRDVASLPEQSFRGIFELTENMRLLFCVMVYLE